MGYRHLDTAQGYRNEVAVGRAVKDSGIPRSELFITTKLSDVWMSEVTYEQALATLDASLEKLQMSYVDLYLIHSPRDAAHRLDQWRALCDAKAAGKVRSIGVSDYTVAELAEIEAAGLELPAALQIEISPWLAAVRAAEVAWARERSVAVEAWGALAVGNKWGTPQVVEVASHYEGKTEADVLLKWCLQMGFVALITSQNPAHQASNLAVATDATWTLTPEELRLLDEIKSDPFFSTGRDISGA